MSLNMWYSTEPVEPKYLQISHQGLHSFCKKNKKDFDAFRTQIHDHHAQPATKDGMFIMESFFSGSTVVDLVAEYVQSKGYKLKENYQDECDGECIVKGYDGILVNWSW